MKNAVQTPSDSQYVCSALIGPYQIGKINWWLFLKTKLFFANIRWYSGRMPMNNGRKKKQFER